MDYETALLTPTIESQVLPFRQEKRWTDRQSTCNKIVGELGSKGHCSWALVINQAKAILCVLLRDLAVRRVHCIKCNIADE